MTRRSDISCRRGEREFAILLPETRESGATVLTKRLREEARRALGTRQPPITVGLVEWQPEESVEALEARAEAALSPAGEARRTGFPAPRPVPRPETVAAPAVQAHAVGTADTLRRDVLEAVAREIVDARPFGRSLAFVALDVEGLEELSERRPGVRGRGARQGRDATRRRASAAVRCSAWAQASSSLVLSGATADDAETLVGSLHGTRATSKTLPESGSPPASPSSSSATDAQTALGRAEHALWQAKQAGPGTVVVAVPGRRTR